MNYIKLENCYVHFPILNQSNRFIKTALINKINIKKMKQFNKSLHIEALVNINLEAKEGDKIGIIGSNGSGKSTLLRLLSGIYPPSFGNYFCNGKISSMINLDLGFDEDGTGIENIKLHLLNNNIMPTKDYIKEVISSSDLSDSIYLPLKTYSTGMRMRLAFSIAINKIADIVLLDEWLAVGDLNFKLKSEKIMNEKLKRSKILFLASHSLDLISSKCNKLIYLKKGKIEYFGNLKIGIEKYKKDINRNK